MQFSDWITSFHFFKKLKKLPFVDEIWGYGSRARGDHQARSDIDLAIVCPRATDAEWRMIQDILTMQIHCLK